MKLLKLKFFKRKENGSAMLIALALLAMLTAIAVMSVDRSTTDVELSYNQLHEDQAFYLAEAGSERAVIKLNEDNNWRTGYSKQGMVAGYYSVTLTDSAADSTLYDTVLVNAKASAQYTNVEIESWVVPEYIYPWRYGMFAGDGINFDKDGCVDSYNSDSGDYAKTRLLKDGDIGTNGTITTSQNVDIGGDATTATGGSIILGPGSKVYGDTTTTMDSVNLDLISDSEYVWAKSVSNMPGGASGSGYTYDAGSRSLVTGRDAVVELQSGVYYFSEITLGQNSSITLAPGADVIIYITGDFNLGQYSNVNSGGDPSMFTVFAEGDLNFDQYNQYYGSFYSPTGHIQYDQTTEVYGSLVGGYIQLDGGACFHYDRNLSKKTKGTTGRMFVVAWRQL